MKNIEPVPSQSNFETPPKKKKEIKSDTFGTKYLKSHVNMVISKIVFPKPQLDIKF